MIFEPTPKMLRHGVHALTGGNGFPVVLLPGWPETALAYSDIFSGLAAAHRLLVLDPPGLGDSGPSDAGYDTAHISTVLAEAVAAETLEEYHLVGHDVGAWIAYAWAAQFPERIKSLTILDAAIPGCGAPLSYPLAHDLNVKLWQFSFNTLPELPEILTKGRERELLDWLFDRKAVHPSRITEERRSHYVASYSREGAMSRGFAYYRAAAESSKQNQQFRERKLAMPVLALGGEAGAAQAVQQSMAGLVERIQGGVLPECGHYMMEEQTEMLTARLLSFFAEAEGTPS